MGKQPAQPGAGDLWASGGLAVKTRGDVVRALALLLSSVKTDQ